MASRGIAAYSSLVRVLARGNARCLSTAGTGAGNDDHEAMIKFMRNIAMKSETEKGAQKTLFSKIMGQNGLKTGGDRKGFRFNPRETAGRGEEGDARDGEASSEKPGRIYNSRTNERRGGSSSGGRGGPGRPLRELKTRGAAWDDGEDEDRPRRKKRGGWSSGEESEGDHAGESDDDFSFDYDEGEEEEDPYGYRDRELTDVDKMFSQDGEMFKLKGGGSEAAPGKLDEIDKQLLFNYDHFADLVKHGDTEIDTEEMDAIDEFLADAFVESFKSEDGSFQQVLESAQAKRRFRVTPPRSLAQLQAFCAPPKLFNSPNEGPAAELAAQAWGVIHKNYYYRDSEKYRLVEKIALMHVKLEDFLARREAEEAAKLPHQRLPRLGMPAEESVGSDSDSDSERDSRSVGAAAEGDDGQNYLDDVELGGVDLIHRVGFRKGLEYLEEETRLLQLAEGGHAVQDETYVQGETDWSVEAVVDEDQL